MDRSGERPIPMLAGVALIGAGALFLGYALFQYVLHRQRPVLFRGGMA